MSNAGSPFTRSTVSKLTVITFPINLTMYCGSFGNPIWIVDDVAPFVHLFTEQNEVGLGAIMLEQILEYGTESAFVCFTELGIFFQFSVIGFDRFMRRLDVQVGYLYSPCVVGIRAIPHYTRSRTKLRGESCRGLNQDLWD